MLFERGRRSNDVDLACAGVRECHPSAAASIAGQACSSSGLAQPRPVVRRKGRVDLRLDVGREQAAPEKSLSLPRMLLGKFTHVRWC